MMKWYVVHTQTGAEEKVKANLENRINAAGLKEVIPEVVIPTEQVSEIRSGKKRISLRKFFPGYLIIKMEMSKDSWYLVKTTPGITGFIGLGNKPSALSETEVENILKR